MLDGEKETLLKSSMSLKTKELLSLHCQTCHANYFILFISHSHDFISLAARSEIRRTREHYLPVATRGAIIYFTLVDLPSLNIMYQFSLPWFVDIFVSCLLSVASIRKQGLRRANSPLVGTLQAGRNVVR